MVAFAETRIAPFAYTITVVPKYLIHYSAKDLGGSRNIPPLLFLKKMNGTLLCDHLIHWYGNQVTYMWQCILL